MSRFASTFTRYLHPRGSVSFWHTPIAPVFYEWQTLSDYYIDFTSKLGYPGPYDSAGVPLLNYFGEVGVRYNPCAVAQWGLGAWQKWRRSGSIESKAKFLIAVEWLQSSLSVDSFGRGFWWYEFPIEAYNVRAPWASALAQAQGISVLLRGAAVAPSRGLRDSASAACKGMLAPIESGGLARHDGASLLLEEVVADRPTAILDGMMFAAMGLQDYCYEFPADKEACLSLELVYSTLAALLPQYDLGYWSRADLYASDPPMPASGFYHRLHVAQLHVLAALTAAPGFGHYADVFASYAANPLCVSRAFLEKVAFKVFHY